MQDWIPQLVAFLGGGGIVGLVKALSNRRPIAVQGELKIVEAALSHNETLRDDLNRAIERIVALEVALSDVRKENVALHESIRNLESDNQKLRDRCDHLEGENARLRQ